MPHHAPLVTLLALAAPALAADRVAPPAGGQIARLTIQQRVVIRVPRVPEARLPLPKPVKWKEKKGPECVAAQTMAGALISAPNQVDLVLIGGKRVRAKLDGDCKPLDFYSGFYVRPSKDGMICRDRDAIRVRSGASCQIDDFKLLQASK
ncbi:hypothetical protein [Sphingomonas sp.]|jgi:hypothetical protein|uniref:hypothetical protein n=1 Tax=Sphingomonas sp. TaxID=28214 RepID=UPI002D7FE72F|nr:hypothetical protein [Sphingomonas sp.]HEU0043470.1 hypothetical protein [Sphingomonas sp.]